MISLMEHISLDIFPHSAKYVKVTYITKEIYVMIIYLSQLFQYTTEPEILTDLGVCILFLLKKSNQLLKATKDLYQTRPHLLAS